MSAVRGSPFPWAGLGWSWLNLLMCLQSAGCSRMSSAQVTWLFPRDLVTLQQACSFDSDSAQEGLSLHQVCYWVLGQSKSYNQVWHQYDRALPNVDTGRCEKLWPLLKLVYTMVLQVKKNVPKWKPDCSLVLWFMVVPCSYERLA